MSSIESAPASIPATSAVTFLPALAPLSAGTVSSSPASLPSRRQRPAAAAAPAPPPTRDSARRTSPPPPGGYERVASARCPSCVTETGPSASPILLPRKGILTFRRATSQDHRWIRAKSRTSPVVSPAMCRLRPLTLLAASQPRLGQQTVSAAQTNRESTTTGGGLGYTAAMLAWARSWRCSLGEVPSSRQAAKYS